MDEAQGGDEFLGFDSGNVSCGEAEGAGGVVYCNKVCGGGIELMGRDTRRSGRRGTGDKAYFPIAEQQEAHSHQSPT